MATAGKDPANDNQDAAVVDQLIKKLRPFDRSFGSPQTSPVDARPFPRILPVRAPMRPAAVWSCVGLGVLLGVALPRWPYARACGWWLLLYMVAVGTVVVAGMWGARVSWKSRLGYAHVIALGTLLWGLALTAHEVLPRVGYAKTRAAWRCHGPETTQGEGPLSVLKRGLNAGMTNLSR